MIAERKDKVQEAFHGKTIKEIDCSAVNCWTFLFTDGTKAEVYTEHAGYGLYGFWLEGWNRE